MLDQLERDVKAIEDVLAGDDQAVARGDIGPWQVPTTSGPIPDVLVPRARRIADRQVDAQEALVARMRSAREQRDVVRRLDPGTRRATRSVYLDTRA